MLTTHNLKTFTSLFSASYLLNLMNGNNLTEFKKTYAEIKKTKNLKKDTSVKDVIDELYRILLTNYRNEYVYKNLLISYIKSEESQLNYALFSEMDIGACSRVDIAHFSSSNHAYEIKTELDSFARLDKQLCDYKKGFEYVWVVVPEQKLKKLLLTVDKSIGIKLLDAENNLIVYRKAQSNFNDITHGGLFSLLRQKEFQLMLKKHYGYEFNNQSQETRSFMLNKFKEINIEEAHKISVSIIKSRVQHHKLQLLMGNTPNSLLPINLNQTIQKKAKSFLNFLNSSMDELDNHIDMMQHRKLF